MPKHAAMIPSARLVLVTCLLLLAVLLGSLCLSPPQVAARGKQRVTVGTEIKRISPSGDAARTGWTRMVVLEYAPGTSHMGRPMAFKAKNARTIFIKVTNQFSSRVRVSRNRFVRFWHAAGRSCEVKWSWRTIGGKRVRYVLQISLADLGTG